MNYKKILVFILSIIGISVVSCMDYGVPQASFEIKGKVTDTLDNPIENIQITLQEGGFHAGEATTDETGNYSFLDGIFVNQYTTLMVKVEDIDGEENSGEFGTQIILLTLKDSDFVKEKGKKKDKWSLGTAKKEINFKLIKKQ